MIMKRIFEDGKQNDIEVFDCNSSLNAVKFYNSMGFVTIEDIFIPFTETIQFPSVSMTYNMLK